MRKVCDSDFGGKDLDGKCKKERKYKLVILDNSGGVGLFGKDEEYKLPELSELTDEIVIDKTIAELDAQLTTIEETRAEDKIKCDIDVYVAKVNKKDDINVKWVRPEEALKIISVYKRNIQNYEYQRRFEILEDENILRDYIIKYIY